MENKEKTSEELVIELQEKVKSLIKENNKLKIDFNSLDIEKTNMEGELEILRKNTEEMKEENSKIKETVLENATIEEQEIEEEKELSYDEFFMKGN